MPRLPRSLALRIAFAALSLVLASGPATAAPPTRVWVAWLDGRSLEDAMATGAVIQDRFPDAVIVSSDAAARALTSAGFRVEPPVDLPAGRPVTLLRAHPPAKGHPHAPLDDATAARLGVTVAWRGGEELIVHSDGVLPDHEALLAYDRQALRGMPLRRAFSRPERDVAAKAPRPELHATNFSPVIQDMVDQVDGDAWIDWIGRLAGREPVTIGGNPHTFTTRSTPTAQCDLAEQYVLEQLAAMGYSVSYDPFSFSGVNARNVVATLPGVERPQRVVVVGGHLDSTSPQASTNARGANDNASGTAALLIMADILRQYSFQSTIKLIAFTGEEQGLHGSQHYADAAAARGDSIVGAVILDMIGWHDQLYQIDIEGENAWLPLMTIMDDACAQYTNLDTQLQFVSFGSDHVPFQDNGFPAFLAIESEYPDFPCYHQTCDTTGWNEPDFGGETVRAVLATAAHLAIPRAFAISHTPLPNAESTVGPYEVVATILGLSPLVTDSLLLHWSNGGPYVEATLTPAGPPNTWRASIPGQSAGTTVSYWLSALDDQGRHAFHPPGAPGDVNQFLVQPRTALMLEGFESGAPGWTHGGTGDEWQFGPPQGLADDPATAFSGLAIAGTDLSGLGSQLGRYEANTDSWLESPPIDCSEATDVRLTFQRKLAVERSNGGNWDYARVWVNGTKLWESPSSLPHLIDPAWTAQSLDLSALADGNPAVRVRFTLKSDASIYFGGWNLDDVAITGLVENVTGVTLGAPPPRATLHAAAPNPGHAATTLRFDLPARAEVDLAIYDVRGRRVRTLVHGSRDAGRHDARWDGRGDDGAPSGSGIYFARLAAGGRTETTKLTLMR